MRSFVSVFQLSLLFSTLGSAHPPDFSPFILALEEEETLYINNETSPQSPAENGSTDLFKRQNCAPNYYYCSTIVTTAVCCSTDSFCSVDNAGNAACCPAGSYCTGTVAIAPAASTAIATTTPILTSTNAAGAIITITQTSTFPLTTVAVTAFTTALSSYVSNAYSFPFPYIASTFANSAACASAYSGCAAEYAVCTAGLQGAAGYGVTIQAPGGGTTVAGQATGPNLGAAAASSVCASLSGQACPGIAGGCAVFGTAGAGSTGVVAGSGADRGWRNLDWSLWVGGAVAVITGVVGWIL